MRDQSEGFVKSGLYEITGKCINRLFGILRQMDMRFQLKNMGSGTHLAERVYVSGGKNIVVGRNCRIGRNVAMYATLGQIEIGDNVTIGDNVRIFSRNIYIGSGTLVGDNVFINAKIYIGKGSWISRGCDLTGNVIIESAILGPFVHCAGEPDHPRDPKSHYISQVADPTGTILTDHPDCQILIKEGAWVGEGTTILKGVVIGAGAIVGAGSVITKDIPSYATAVGNPGRVIKQLEGMN